MSFSGVPPAVRKARKPVTIRPTQETFQPLNAFGKSQIIKTITAIIIRSPKKPSESVENIHNNYIKSKIDHATMLSDKKSLGIALSLRCCLFLLALQYINVVSTASWPNNSLTNSMSPVSS